MLIDACSLNGKMYEDNIVGEWYVFISTYSNLCSCK